ncbi:MAG: fibronectin type III domain-containing protein [Bacteroidota bacterium]
MKKFHLFILMFLFLAACKENSVDSTVTQPAPVVLTKDADSVTATRAVLVGEITGNAFATFEYGTSTSYGNTINAVPNYVNGKATVKATLVGLTPGTTYHFRARASNPAFVNGNDMTFVTGTQLQIGDSYKKGVVIDVHTVNGVQHGLLAAPVDLTPTWGPRFNFFAATEAATKYGEGYRLPDSTEMKFVRNAYKLGILTNFVDPNYDSHGIYITSTEMTGNANWIFIVKLYGYDEGGWLNKNSSASSRAVCSF